MPVVLLAKKILQELDRLKLAWDDIIPDHLAHRWSNWTIDLCLLENFEVVRCFKPVGLGEVTFNQLHHFADASDDLWDGKLLPSEE